MYRRLKFCLHSLLNTFIFQKRIFFFVSLLRLFIIRAIDQNSLVVSELSCDNNFFNERSQKPHEILTQQEKNFEILTQNH